MSAAAPMKKLNSHVVCRAGRRVCACLLGTAGANDALLSLGSTSLELLTKEFTGGYTPRNELAVIPFTREERLWRRVATMLLLNSLDESTMCSSSLVCVDTFECMRRVHERIGRRMFPEVSVFLPGEPKERRTSIVLSCGCVCLPHW